MVSHTVLHGIGGDNGNNVASCIGRWEGRTHHHTENRSHTSNMKTAYLPCRKGVSGRHANCAGKGRFLSGRGGVVWVGRGKECHQQQCGKGRVAGMVGRQAGRV